MHYYSIEVVFQEVPGEISICFSISGCPLRCEGCHSPFLWKDGNGRIMTRKVFIDTLCRYSPMATCVLFMGGEWHEDELVSYLKLARKMNFKTCLYTGEDNVSDRLLNELTWLKTGKWIPSLGALNCRTTNQNFTQVSTNKNYNHLFLI
ncbi:MAG: anaerobic ribonucleoside-triphosphate reductase activating protein [Flavobacteriaceae bacterium]|nr:anaerobic ribonucleoside-triphosphate reductase activating protein [Flavobacteriaceae bacterium]